MFIGAFIFYVVLHISIALTLCKYFHREKIMDGTFLRRIRRAFARKDYHEVIRQWGVDTSNNMEFKRSAYEHYQPRKNDVIVSTYPKSGTTWMKQMAYQIGYKGEGDYTHIDRVIPWPDNLVPMDDMAMVDDFSLVANSPTGLHVIKSHLEAEYIPYNDEAKYICVIRDPKDTLVSIVHFDNGFNQLLFGETVPVDAWVDAFQTNNFVYQPWAELTDSWWRLRNRDNVLVYLYEDMIREGEQCIKKVADFLEITLSESEFSKVVEKSSFAYMKKNDHLFSPPAWNSGHVPMVRSGKSGNSRELLSVEQNQAIDDHCMKTLADMDSEFPYEELYVK